MNVDALQYPVPERKWFEEWRRGDLDVVQVTTAVWEDSRETFQNLARWHHIVKENEDLVGVVMNPSDITRITESGRTAVVLGFQNTAPIEHNIDLIGLYKTLGVHVMQLTYNLQNYIGSGYWEKKDTGISSRFGQNAIQEMNDTGVLIDLSHCGERTTIEAIELSDKPASITHANPRDFVGTPNFGSGRVKQTEAIKLLAEKGGVLGLSPNRHMTKNGIETTLKEFSDMVAWTADVIGVDAIGLGSDYCPGHDPSVRNWWRYAKWSRQWQDHDQAPHEGWQSWLRNPSDFPNIAAGLKDVGFVDSEVEKIMGKNWADLFTASF